MGLGLQLLARIHDINASLQHLDGITDDQDSELHGARPPNGIFARYCPFSCNLSVK